MPKPYIPLELGDFGVSPTTWFDDWQNQDQQQQQPLSELDLNLHTPNQAERPTTTTFTQSQTQDHAVTDLKASLAVPNLLGHWQLPTNLDSINNNNSNNLKNDFYHAKAEKNPPAIPPKSPSRLALSAAASTTSLRETKTKAPTPRITSGYESGYRIQKLVSEPGLPPTNTQTQVEVADPWIVCMALVHFDIELGPDLQILCPAGSASSSTACLTDSDYRAIAFSALPERSQNKELAPQFHTFTFVPSSLGSQELSGFAVFEQKKTHTAIRGYTQESLVIVATRKYPQLFNACLQLTAAAIRKAEREPERNDKDGYDLLKNKGIAHKQNVIEAAVASIQKWPHPALNSTLELPFLGTVISLSIPLHESVPLLGTVDPNSTTSTQNQLAPPPNLASNHHPNLTPKDVPVITASEPAATWDHLIPLVPDLADLYILYEYVLLAKPIVVYASTPHQCSTFISLLVDMIRPIPYAGRVREYVTMHTCAALSEEEDMAGIVGVTNPFLVKKCARNEQTLVFVLSALSSSSNGVSGAAQTGQEPLTYYSETTSTGVSILRRRHSMQAGIVRKNIPPPLQTPRPAHQSRSQTPSTSSASSWRSRILSRKLKDSSKDIQKARISSPIVTTFVRLPNKLTPIQADPSVSAKPVGIGLYSGSDNYTYTAYNPGTAADEFKYDTLDNKYAADTGLGQGASPDNSTEDDAEESKIKASMRRSRRLILKNRLLQPDPKFIASISKLIKAESYPNRYSSFTPASPITAKTSIDLAIRLHFATVTSRFLDPLACYLDPTSTTPSTANTATIPAQTATSRRLQLPQSHSELGFSQSDFMSDPAVAAALTSLKTSESSTAGSAQNKQALKRFHRGQSMIVLPTTNTSNDPGSGLIGLGIGGLAPFAAAASPGSDNDSKTLIPISDDDDEGDVTYTEETDTNHVKNESKEKEEARNRALMNLTQQQHSKQRRPASLVIPKMSPNLLISVTEQDKPKPQEPPKTNRRASMLELSSLELGTKFTATTPSNISSLATSEPQFETSSRRKSLRRRSAIFSSISEAAHKRSSLLLHPKPSITNGLSGSASTGTDPVQDAQASLNAQPIYKTFVKSPNFKSWLNMNPGGVGANTDL